MTGKKEDTSEVRWRGWGPPFLFLKFKKEKGLSNHGILYGVWCVCVVAYVRLESSSFQSGDYHFADLR